MGRKKRKVVVEDDDAGGTGGGKSHAPDPSVVVKDEDVQTSTVGVKPEQKVQPSAIVKETEEVKEGKSSKYAVSSHSGEIVREDIYISDGSEDEEEDVEVVLAGSRSGIMRRGLTAPATMMQPNRLWVRPGEDPNAVDDDVKPEELEKLDPVQRAARLQAEKQRREQQEKEEERLKESQENAGRDPTLFSKRTAFDIRFDQMEDKPWERASDLSDFFNYSLDEEGWLEYAQQQLTIRQELTDASRSKRPPDPNVVPVAPRTPTSQAPRVAVVGSNKNEGKGDEEDGTEPEEANDSSEPLGPSLPAEGVSPKSSNNITSASTGDMATESEKINVGAGGAWGAGAIPGSLLAQLIEEQEKRETEPGGGSSNNNNLMDTSESGAYHGEQESTGPSRHHSDGHGHYGKQQDGTVGGSYGGGGGMHGGAHGGTYGATESGSGGVYGQSSDPSTYGDSAQYEGGGDGGSDYRRGYWGGGRGRGRGGRGDYGGSSSWNDRDDTYSSRKRTREWRR